LGYELPKKIKSHNVNNAFPTFHTESRDVKWLNDFFNAEIYVFTPTDLRGTQKSTEWQDIIIIYLSPSSVRVVATFSGTVLFPLPSCKGEEKTN
jgi:hypothetical protein